MGGIQGSAVFSDESPPLFRHRLDRWWSDEPRALVCMANPSYAGADTNDPTIFSLIRLMRPLPGVGGFTVVNWHDYIATDPRDLHRWREAEAWNNADAYRECCEANIRLIAGLAEQASLVIVAWGNLVPRVPHTTKVLTALSCGGTRPLHVFGLTKDGSPKHPMARGKARIPDGAAPMIWQEAP